MNIWLCVKYNKNFETCFFWIDNTRLRQRDIVISWMCNIIISIDFMKSFTFWVYIVRVWYIFISDDRCFFDHDICFIIWSEFNVFKCLFFIFSDCINFCNLIFCVKYHIRFVCRNHCYAVSFVWFCNHEVLLINFITYHVEWVAIIVKFWKVIDNCAICIGCLNVDWFSVSNLLF